MVAGGAPTGTPMRGTPAPPRRPGSGTPGTPLGSSGASAVPVPTPAPAIPTPVPGTVSGPIYNDGVDLVGHILADRYRILKKLGEGGMGTVYLAEHTTINKRLAIKVLSPEYSHKQDLVDRFLQEARAASMIEQENVVEITDYGSTPGGSVFFAMEFLNGEDLAGTVKREGGLAWSRVKVIMLQICSALSAAHAAGIIHRDMKPENCYRIRRGNNEDFIKVLDFGIAKVQSDEGDGARALTRTGMIFGTPEYMSPEQAKGERVDHRVDVYAVGVIMYELLTGRVPFTADTFMGILTKHMFEAPPAPSAFVPEASIPYEAEAVILKALQKDREYRFQNMAEMARAIEAVGTGAAAVSLVAESVSAPRSGQIRYAGSSTAINLGDELDDGIAPPRSRLGLFIGLGVAAAVLVGGGIFAAQSFGGDPPTPTAPVVTIGAELPSPVQNPAVGEASVAGVALKPESQMVEVTISTPGIDAEVHSDSDDGLIGRTNAPFSLPRADVGFAVRVRAPGYQDLSFEIQPDARKTIQVKLEKLSDVMAPSDDTGEDVKEPASPGDTKKARDKKRDKKVDKNAGAEPKTEPKVEPKTEPKVEPKTEPKVEPKTEPKKPGSSPDLKDPFHKG
jgi:eukaryotic-like serine/threonine-protein kinase